MVATGAQRLEKEGRLEPYNNIEVPKEADENKRRGWITAIASSFSQAFASSGMCFWAASAGVNYPLVEFISAATGWNFDGTEALTAGKRILTLRQAFNIREGLAVRDFSLPERLTRPALMGPPITQSIDLDALLTGFYEAMGWEEDGVTA
jgi:aldehyde:ferredoxin oxidoreductase